MRILIYAIVLLAIIPVFNGCSSLRKMGDLPDVTIAINIRSSDNDLNFINLHLYKLKLIDILDDFQSVHFDLVESDENPELLLDITIPHFNVWPKEERVTRRAFARNIVVGQDQNGRPVYQTVRASADVVQLQIRANATFETRMRQKGNTKIYEKSFPSNFRWGSVYLENIRGDMRAIDPFVATTPPFEPEDFDLLLALSKDEMVTRLSREIRTYFR